MRNKEIQRTALSFYIAQTELSSGIRWTTHKVSEWTRAKGKSE